MEKKISSENSLYQDPYVGFGDFDEDWLPDDIITATRCRLLGNDAYYLGDFSRALALYNEGLALDNNDGLLAANKTQALLKLERYPEVVEATNSILATNENDLKALLRRGTALAAMCHLQEALRDFQKVVVVEPNNRPAVAKIDELEQRIALEDELHGILGELPPYESDDESDELQDMQNKSQARLVDTDNSAEKAKGAEDEFMTDSNRLALEEEPYDFMDEMPPLESGSEWDESEDMPSKPQVHLVDTATSPMEATEAKDESKAESNMWRYLSGVSVAAGIGLIAYGVYRLFK